MLQAVLAELQLPVVLIQQIMVQAEAEEEQVLMEHLETEAEVLTDIYTLNGVEQTEAEEQMVKLFKEYLPTLI